MPVYTHLASFSYLTAPRLRGFGAALAGAVLFSLAGLPLPFLLGPMAACLLLALAGVHLADAGKPLSNTMRTILGVAIGATVSPALIHALPQLGATLAVVPLFVLVIGMTGYPFFRWVMGFDHPTAFYAAMPGGLQDMLVFGQEAGGDVRAMSLIHATRVLIIVSVAPMVLHYVWGTRLDRPPGLPFAEVPLGEIALMVVAGIAGWQLAKWVGMFGASILGPLILAAAFSLSGLLEHRPPAEMIQAAQFFIGLSVGSKYSGITWRELRFDVGAGAAYALVLAVISLGVFALVRLLSEAPPLDLLLSFLPGGQAEMAVIAIVAGADVAFVVAHHLVRIFTVILLAPVVARWLDRRAGE